MPRGRSRHWNMLDQETYLRWILTRRVQAMGLLPRTAEATIWSSCGDSAQNKHALAQLVAEGILTPVHIGEKSLPYYMLTSTLNLLDAAPLEPRMLLLGPLDSMLWDRKTLRYIFDFDYIWEVYKPEHLRRWGYYVLPVFYGDRFVARIDSRLEKGIWTITHWWWEADVVPDAEMLAALPACPGCACGCRSRRNLSPHGSGVAKPRYTTPGYP